MSALLAAIPEVDAQRDSQNFNDLIVCLQKAHENAVERLSQELASLRSYLWSEIPAEHNPLTDVANARLLAIPKGSNGLGSCLPARERSREFAIDCHDQNDTLREPTPMEGFPFLSPTIFTSAIASPMAPESIEVIVGDGLVSEDFASSDRYPNAVRVFPDQSNTFYVAEVGIETGRTPMKHVSSEPIVPALTNISSEFSSQSGVGQLHVGELVVEQQRSSSRIGAQQSVWGLLKSDVVDLLPHWKGSSENRDDFIHHECIAPAAGTNRVFVGEESAWIAKPSSPYRICWSAMAVLVVLLDSVLIPLQLIHQPDTAITDIFNLIDMIFWTVDLALNFFVGFYDRDGTLNLKFPDAPLDYASRRMLIDLPLVVLEWVPMLHGARQFLQVVSVTKVHVSHLSGLRILQFFRLIRFYRLQSFLTQIEEMISSVRFIVHLGMLKILAGLLLCLHFVACSWYGVGDTPSGWVDLEELRDESFTHKYLVVFHWSLAQFGVGESRLVPVTDAEHALSIVVLITMLFGFSSLVSNITHAMAALHGLRHERQVQFGRVRRYCTENQITAELVHRVLRYLDFAYARYQRSLPFDDVWLLSLLSKPLREELQLQTVEFHVQGHGLYRRLLLQDRHCMQRIVAYSFTWTSIARDDVLFRCGQSSKAMFFLTEGKSTYHVPRTEANDEESSSPLGISSIFHDWLSTRSRMSDHQHQDLGADSAAWPVARVNAVLSKGDWIAEPALWMSWAYFGELHATRESVFIEVDSKKFGESVTQDFNVCLWVTDYAQWYVKKVKDLSQECCSDLVYFRTCAFVLRRRRSLTQALRERTSRASRAFKTGCSDVQWRWPWSC
eukprot:TRINITY_DN22803_c0_g1_i1.p1 TRINITY_DN22803_c0_g1~~TRINITY_DN22803_c0_g1_i1.p1  ORF type:complete len:840 (+),score=106.36 TRINITY_DN22803_c0_g1_i1:120-2639(+)